MILLFPTIQPAILALTGYKNIKAPIFIFLLHSQIPDTVLKIANSSVKSIIIEKSV
jgi:hypothetical protein